jgi:hypothetical protein
VRQGFEELIKGVGTPFAEASMIKKIGRAVCWDLVQFALNRAGAKWDGGYGFGIALDWLREPVMRGDIVQFEKVLIERWTERSLEQKTLGPHGAGISFSSIGWWWNTARK